MIIMPISATAAKSSTTSPKRARPPPTRPIEIRPGVPGARHLWLQTPAAWSFSAGQEASSGSADVARSLNEPRHYRAPRRRGSPERSGKLESSRARVRNGARRSTSTILDRFLREPLQPGSRRCSRGSRAFGSRSHQEAVRSRCRYLRRLLHSADLAMARGCGLHGNTTDRSRLPRWQVQQR